MGKTAENQPKTAKNSDKVEEIWAPSLAELAVQCGKTVPTVLSYRVNHGAPTEKVPGKGYSVTALRKWMDEHGYIPRVHPRKPIGVHNDEVDLEEVEDEEEDPDADLPPSRRAVRERLRGQKIIPASQAKVHPKERLLRAQAVEREARGELAKLKLSVERGEFIPKEDVVHRDIARIQMVKRGLLGLVRTLPPRLVGLNTGEMEVVLKEAMRELLTRFSQM